MRHHGHFGAAVLGVISQLGQGAHGIDRHHRRAHAHDRIKGDDKLRAVLTHQQHTVTARHAQRLLQISGHGLDLLVQLAVGEDLLGKDQRGLVRVTQRRRLHIVVERDLRHTQVVRHALGPVGVVRRVRMVGGVHRRHGLKVRRGGGHGHRLREISSFMTSLVPP